MRKVRRKDPRPKPLKRQRDVLCDVMLSAGACETWLKLVELSRVTHYGEASISAQLRHLRKPLRRVRGGEAPAGSCGSFVWRGTRASVEIPAESRGAARCDFRGGAEG